MRTSPLIPISNKVRDNRVGQPGEMKISPAVFSTVAIQ